MTAPTTPTNTPSKLGTLARSDIARKAVKYAGVSLFGVVTTQVLIVLFHLVMGVSPVPTNIAAVGLAAVPCYLLNRSWVWGKSGPSHFRREVLPFWGFAFAGLVLSTVIVSWVERYSASHTNSDLQATLLISAGNLAGFGILWVARFFVLDRILFKDAHEGESFLEHLAEDAPLA